MKKNYYKQIREYLGLTQDQISEDLEMSQPGWQRVEANKVGLSDKRKRILNTKYGVSYKYMIDGTGDILENEKRQKFKTTKVIR